MIDLHCHLDLFPDPAQVARECHSRKMYVLSVTTTPSAWHGTAALSIPESKIRTALGLHPQIAHQRHTELSLFDDLVGQTKYVGEIGLDGAPEYRPYWDIQLRVFEHILRSCTNAGGRILTIHSRHASANVLDMLEKFPNAGTPILHWYTGGQRDLERAIELGCWFSVGPAMLQSDRGRKNVSRMVRDRILTESDGPFAQIDGIAVRPWEVEIAEIELGQLWGVSQTETSRILVSNLRRLLNQAKAEEPGMIFS